MARFEFPKGFFWGASTSSHQVEGGTHNQWSEWERSPAQLAQLEKDGLIAKYGKENFISGRAADHYRRFEDDFELARELGHTATRISIEWSRIEPREGEFDMKEIAHYRNVIASIRKNGMEPFVTLWHWTMPVWFCAKGAFERKENIPHFVRFAETLARELADVRFWISLNEPEIYAMNGYLRGQWPPQKKSATAFLAVFHNLARAHRAAYEKIKEVHPAAQVGIAKNNVYFEAYRHAFADSCLKTFADWGWNFYFLNRIRHCQDFIGLNQYAHNLIRGGKFKQNENLRTSDLGLELYPEAMYHVLRDLKRYGVPIYVTEHGLADARDVNRAWFIKASLQSLHRAMREGVNVRGYLHWALMDNFEWSHGFWPRSGLIGIDYATQERSPRPSAFVYKKICEENAVEIDEASVPEKRGDD